MHPDADVSGSRTANHRGVVRLRPWWCPQSGLRPLSSRPAVRLVPRGTCELLLCRAVPVNSVGRLADTSGRGILLSPPKGLEPVALQSAGRQCDTPSYDGNVPTPGRHGCSARRTCRVVCRQRGGFGPETAPALPRQPSPTAEEGMAEEGMAAALLPPRGSPQFVCGSRPPSFLDSPVPGSGAEMTGPDPIAANDAEAGRHILDIATFLPRVSHFAGDAEAIVHCSSAGKCAEEDRRCRGSEDVCNGKELIHFVVEY